MSSLLIFSRPSNNALRDVQQHGQPERGDVVDISEDDLFDWGNAIRTIGWWQVVVVRNAGLRELGGLLTTSRYDPLMAPTSWRHRVWRIDLDALSDGQLSAGVWVVPLDRLLAAAAIKPQTRDTVEIGQPAYAIG